MANKIDFSKRICCVVTGASQGIGQALAIELGKKFSTNSTLLLLARSEQGLNNTKTQIEQVNSSINTITHSINLTRPKNEDIENVFMETTSKIKQDNLDYAIIVHNAGTIGDVTKKAIEFEDFKELEDYYSLNVFSPIIINTIFVKTFSKFNPKFIIINISSLCGRQPFKNLSIYGSGKAARELYFKVMAEEEPNFIILSYSPGPVETNMSRGVAKSSVNTELKGMFADMIEKKTILQPEMTVSKLVNVLEKGEYKSGDVIDYYDRI